jgi:ATP:corrinoid adenosyltransferase
VSDERNRGLVIVNTGDGKGKSSSAFGMMVRAVARGWNVIVIQFIKSEKWQTGEHKIADQLGVDWITGGDGFTWESDDLEATERAALDTWEPTRSPLGGCLSTTS